MIKKYTSVVNRDYKDRPIIGFGRGLSYLVELFSVYKDIPDRFVALFDDNKREQNIYSVEGKRVKVADFSELRNCLANISVNPIYLILDDYYREMYDLMIALPELKGFLDDIYYFANYETEIEERYREKYSESPLKNIIVFRSGPHPSQYVEYMDFADNSRALFEYMLENGLNDKYELVWFVKDPSQYSRFNNVKNVSFLSYTWAVEGTKEQQDSYYRALCLSKYLFFTDAYGFARNCRNDQIRVQLWHGCGFKSRVNFTRCEKRYEYMTVTGPLYAKYHSELFGLREEQMITEGLPKGDWVFKPVKTTFFDLFGVKNSSRYIMWMPTFREAGDGLSNLNEYSLSSDTGLPLVGSEEELQELNRVLDEEDTALLIKLHPYQKKKRVVDQYSNIYMIDNDDLNKMDIPINKILGKCDALISDYSSVAIDYLILDRPIGFVLEDMSKYKNSRGFVFDPLEDYLPGKSIFNFDDFVNFVKDVVSGRDDSGEKRRGLLDQMYSHTDGMSCSRIVKYLSIQ